MLRGHKTRSWVTIPYESGQNWASWLCARCCCCSTGHWTWDWPPKKDETLVRLSSETYVCIPHRQVIDSTYSASPPVINDSSLAVIVSGDNDRHLFFQGSQGMIRRMIYRTNYNQWIADPDSIAISDAKLLTPLAVSRHHNNSEEVSHRFKGMEAF